MGGRYAEGWPQYEFRWLQPPLLGRRPSFRKPVWAGQDLRGKTILLRTEQGVGDVIQFIRYAPHVKALGATVLLQVRPGVGDLAKGFPGIDRILDPNEPYPEFDYYIHLMSLPRAFGTELASVPSAVPYLRVDSERRAQWEGRLRGVKKFKVGLVWAGDADHLRDRYRSISLGVLVALAEVQGVQFYSLQKGAPAEQIALAPPGMDIADLGPELLDFADTAAVLDQLDLMIGVDTSVVHLAGALGKPVWTLIASPPDFRWMLDREDTPWYPTMRLFRQREPGDWAGVIGRVKAELENATRLDTAWQSAIQQADVPLPAPTLHPVAPQGPALPGATTVAETAVGIVQYFPEQPLIGESIAWYGEYLQPQVNMLARLIKSGATVVEVGCGVGVHVLAMAPAVGSAGHFILYESRPLFQQVLRQNLGANGVTNVTMMKGNVGIAKSSGDVNSREQNRVEEDAMGSHAAPETIDGLRLEVLHWLKVNEDADPVDVIRGAGATLWRLRPSVFAAARDEQHLQQIVESVRDFGYQCWRMDTTYFNPENFNRREADVFAARQALAVLAIPEEANVVVGSHASLKRT
jgi:hypothetical protein